MSMCRHCGHYEPPVQRCETCGGPLTVLNSNNIKQCIDHPEHDIYNPLKDGQKPLIKATR
jgi:hypothetical protein